MRKGLMKGSIIGEPNSNVKIYIVDPQQKLCPIGVAGEMCIAGNQLARGYINERKENSYIDSTILNRKIYKTGDYARWLNNGKIEFLGRKDKQVKIRGYRIELFEIESVISKNPKVNNVVVLDRVVGKEKELVAYVKGKESLNVDQLKEEIRLELPSHMVPSYFIEVTEFPTSINGKLLDKVLPAPEKKEITKNTSLTNEVELRLEEIWRSLLPVQNIGLDDNFFDLGGNSIKIMSVTRLVKESFDVLIPVVDLYKYNTIRLLSRKISQVSNQEEENSDLKIESSITTIQNTINILNHLNNNDEKSQKG